MSHILVKILNGICEFCYYTYIRYKQSWYKRRLNSGGHLVAQSGRYEGI